MFAAIDATGRPLVFVVRMASGFRCGAIFSISVCLIARFSVTASMTQSQSASRARSASKLPQAIRAASEGSKRPRALIFWRLDRLRSLAASVERSSSTTGSPALARCAAMRDPMVPAPVRLLCV